MLPVNPRSLEGGLKIFVVFTLPNPDDWGDQGVALAAGALHAPPPGTRYVVIDNDSSPELEASIASVAETLGSKVQRILYTPKWKIVSDIFTGQAAAGSREPVLVASAGHHGLTHPLEVKGLLGPSGAVSEDFVFSEDPSELIQVILAKTKGWPNQDVFAPALHVHARAGATPTQIPPLGNLATMLGVGPTGPGQRAPAPLPYPVHPSLVEFYQERLGPEATTLLVALQTISQIADDFVDGDVPAEHRSEMMRILLEAALLQIPQDPFFVANRAVLREAIAQCISVWALSNELTPDTTTESRVWCYVQREAFQMVVWRVAVLVGGLGLGRDVLRDLQQMLHGRNGGAKKFPEWLEETRARTSRG